MASQSTVEDGEEEFKYKFCHYFLMAADSELDSRLKNPSTTSTVVQGVITALCAGVGLITGHSEIGKMAAKAVNALIVKMDVMAKEKMSLHFEVNMDMDLASEFQKSFHLLMLKSALEIWHGFETQLRAVHYYLKSDQKNGSTNYGKVKKGVWSKKADSGKGTKDKTKWRHGLRQLAKYAAMRCIHYLIEKKSLDHLHQFVLTSDLVNKAKAKYRQWFVDRILLECGENFFIEKSTVQFFSEPVVAVFSGNIFQNSQKMSGVGAGQSQNGTLWLLRNDKKNVVGKLDESFKMRLRRPLDFEWEMIRSDQNYRAKFEPFGSTLDSTYFVWSNDDSLNEIYEKLKPYNDSKDDGVMYTNFKESFEILIKNCEKMDLLQKKLEEIKLVVTKLLDQQRDVCVVQEKICQNLTTINSTSKDVKQMVEQVGHGQSIVEEKVDHIIEKLKNLPIIEQGQSSSSNGDPVTMATISFNLSESPTTLFTGRKDFLNQLHLLIVQETETKSALKKPAAVVISGLGGIGKSSVAKMYAQKFKENNGNVAWFNAETEESLNNSFWALAVHLKICKNDEKNSITTPQLVNQVYSHFSLYSKDQQQKDLFIFDNANQLRTTKDEFGIINFLPNAEPLQCYPTLLVTSRNKGWGGLTQSVLTLDCLGHEEGQEYFWNSFGLNFEDAQSINLKQPVQKLVKMLGGYPLAMNLAVAAILENVDLIQNFPKNSPQYFQTVQTEMENYMAGFSQSGSKWMDYESSDYGNGLDKYDKFMGTVWQCTMDKIGRHHGISQNGIQPAIDLLNLMAYLPPDSISVELCHLIHHNVQMSEAFIETKIDDDVTRLMETRRVFGVLEKFSMVTVGHPKKIYVGSYYCQVKFSPVQIHRLVQKWTRETLRRENNFEPLLNLARYIQFNGLDSQFAYQVRDHLKENGWPGKSYRLSISTQHFGRFVEDRQVWLELFNHFIQNQNLQKEDEEYFQTFKLALHYSTNFLDRRSDEWVNVQTTTTMELTKEQFFELVMDQSIKFPTNELLFQLVILVLRRVDKEMLQKKIKKVRRWIRTFFTFLGSAPVIVSLVALHIRQSIFLTELAGSLFSPKELIGRVTKMAHFRLQNDPDLHSLSFLSSTILNIASWPVDAWKVLDTRRPWFKKQDEEARCLLKAFEKNDGIAFLTTALTKYADIFFKGHFFEMEHMVIFGIIQNLSYFDAHAMKLLESTKFMDALTLAFDAASQQQNRTVDDRRAIIGLVFSWLALMSKKDRLQKYPISSNSVVVNFGRFVHTVEVSLQVGILRDGPCPEYFEEIQCGRFAESRRGILHTFLSSYDEDCDSIGVNFYDSAQKLWALVYGVPRF